MKKLFCLSLFLICFNQLFSQKPPIDSSVFNKWPSVGGAVISNDGKYALYYIENQPIGNNTLVLVAIDNHWRKEFIGTKGVEFTDDGREAILLNQNDSLVSIKLGESSIHCIGLVQSFKLSSNPNWIAYIEKSAEQKLVLLNRTTGTQKVFSSVNDYLFGESGKVLLLHFQKETGQSLIWVTLNSGTIDTVWEGGKAMNFVLDKNDTQLAFSCVKEGKEDHSFLIYRAGQYEKAKQLPAYITSGIDSGLQIETLSEFNNVGSLLFCYVKEKYQIKIKPDAVSVDVWSYMDSKLQSAQLKELNPKRYLAVINIKDKQVIRLIGENEVQYQRYSGDDIQSVSHRDNNVDPGEYFWNDASGMEYLLFIKENKRLPIVPLKGTIPSLFNLSPEKKFVIFYDARKKNYYSFNVSTQAIANITEKIKTDWSVYGLESGRSVYGDGAVSAWMKGDSVVLLHDQNDIWKVDLSGKALPISFTNGYGKKHNIFFRLAIGDGKAIVDPNDTLLLVAFNRTNKDNGFFAKKLNGFGDPTLLTMGPYMYEYPINGQYGETPKKARDAASYIVKRMNASESPNYYSTTDFKTFIQLSAVYPERFYNWLKTELVNWKAPNGQSLQGILYKPENIDTTKRYPIIFYYYEKLSERLNVYNDPELSYGRLNIAWYVSNGYLVFTPDIHYKIGEPGESVVNCVISAAQFLKKRSWVDGKRMGLQGHSWGGCETNYLVTHSNIFAAAVSASGIYDFISEYGALLDRGESLHNMHEVSQFRIGAALWNRPDLYIKNSSIFSVKNVTTPFLMMHTKDDGISLFGNAVEFFTALRRLGKKAWMLQYDGYNHSVSGKAAEDFTIRMQQFFDHYLKYKPAPRWMTQGIPAKMKGIDYGLEFDDLSK